MTKNKAHKKKALRKAKTAGSKGRKAAPSKRRKETRSAEPSTLSGRTFPVAENYVASGPGTGSAGQSGDLQGLSQSEIADSESVAELVEEGQAYEADVVSGVENAREADEGEVVTHEVRQDDVPEEYTEKD